MSYNTISKWMFKCEISKFEYNKWLLLLLNKWMNWICFDKPEKQNKTKQKKKRKCICSMLTFSNSSVFIHRFFFYLYGIQHVQSLLNFLQKKKNIHHIKTKSEKRKPGKHWNKSEKKQHHHYHRQILL